ncbi:MAG: hypothetical protein AAGD38_23895 [Acidobacteriota bacterium]
MRYLSVILALLALLAVPTVAQDDNPFEGVIRIGYRSVDVDGSESKFEEDYNLEDGPRLFALRLDFIPEEGDGLSKYLDRMSLDAQNLGGDPFESLNLRLTKSGRFDFTYNRTESTYFLNDILDGHPDFRTFDLERVRDTADLRLTFSPRAELTAGFERFTKRGESTIPLDISRDEFEFDAPVDESYNDFTIGFQYRWPKVTLVIEESYREYDNQEDFFLPGASVGEDPNDATVLDFFFLDRPYQYEANTHTVRVNARPTDRWLIEASASLQHLELEAEATETSQGVSFQGIPFTTDFVGGGDIDRDFMIFDLALTYRVTDDLAVIGSVRQRELEQEGAFDFEGNLNRSIWEIDTTAIDAGLEWVASDTVTVSGGLRLEERDVATAHTTDGDLSELEEGTTEHEGFFLTLAWRPGDRFRLDATVENSSYDDPYTTSSPTDRQRVRLRAHLDIGKGFYGEAIYLDNRYENDISDWDADREQLDLRAGYRGHRIDATVGYAIIDQTQSIDQMGITAPGFNGNIPFLVPILYESEADFFDVRLRWRATDRIRLGGEFLLYENEGNFPIERDIWRGWVEFDVWKRYLLNLGFRSVDYTEDDDGVDDYEAEIVEVSIGYRF